MGKVPGEETNVFLWRDLIKEVKGFTCVEKEVKLLPSIHFLLTHKSCHFRSVRAAWCMMWRNEHLYKKESCLVNLKWSLLLLDNSYAIVDSHLGVSNTMGLTLKQQFLENQNTFYCWNEKPKFRVWLVISEFQLFFPNCWGVWCWNFFMEYPITFFFWKCSKNKNKKKIDWF